MIRNANLGQFLELSSMITKNLPKHIDEATAKAWIENPGALRDALHAMLLKGTMARTTGLHFEGPHSWITQGRSATLLRENGWNIDARIGPNGNIAFHVEMPGGGDHWDLRFAPPQGSQFSVGEYPRAARFQTDQKPGLDFSGCHRGNNTLSGSFQILEIEIADDELIAFAADFIQYEEGQSGKRVQGSIRYNSAIPRAAF